MSSKRKRKQRKKRRPRMSAEKEVVRYREDLPPNMNITLSFLSAAALVCRSCHTNSFTAKDIRYRLEAILGKRTDDAEEVTEEMAQFLVEKGFLLKKENEKYVFTEATLNGVRFSRFMDVIESDNQLGFSFLKDPVDRPQSEFVSVLDLEMPRQQSLAIISMISYVNNKSTELDSEIQFDGYKEHVDEVNGYISDPPAVRSAFQFLESTGIVKAVSEDSYRLTSVFLTAMLLGPYIDGRK